MVFRRAGDNRRDEVVEEDEDGLNIRSEDDDSEDEEADEPLFKDGDLCWVCQEEPGRVGLDPSCGGEYPGLDPVLLGEKCLPAALKEAYGATEGIGVIVEPFGTYGQHLYYRLDEMPSYGFTRDDVEGVSWLMLTIGDACARCGEQSHFTWLTKDFVDSNLPEEEDESVFRDLDRDTQRLCRSCAADALARAYAAMKPRLVTVELPRGAMGVMIPARA